MWAMQQSTQPNYIPANQDEENYNPNLNSSQSKRSGRTHFNVYLNTPQQAPLEQHHHQYASPPCQQFAQPQNMWFTPPPVYVQAPPPPPIYGYPPPYGMQPLPQQQQQPTVIFMQQPPQEKKKEEPPPKKEKKKEEPKPPPPPPVVVAPPPPPPPPKPDDMLDICIASIIIFCIGFMLGICAVVRSNDAYDAHLEYEEDINNGNSTTKSGTMYETWQMARNTALGTGAAAVVCFSLAFLLVFWSGINHKMKRKVEPGFCMAGCLISGWIVFALTFLVDIVVLVLAFDSDNVVYPEVVWAAFVGNVVAWFLMLTHSELARRVE